MGQPTDDRADIFEAVWTNEALRRETLTIHEPPEHPAGTAHLTKAEADAAEHH